MTAHAVVQPRPCSAVEASARAIRIVAAKTGQYVLGTGDYRPRTVGGVLTDVPWTDRGDGAVGSDCAGFAISWCYKLVRHRPGFNNGGAYDCEDDINCNSLLGDAMGAQDCFTVVQDDPLPGDLVAYPTFRLKGDDGKPLMFIGHVGIVIGVDRVDATTWDPDAPQLELLDVAQCHGPNGFAPGAVRTDGSVWAHHNTVWPKPEHRAYLVRAVP